MKDFSIVKRYDPEDVRVGEMPWETCRGDMDENICGSYVEYKDYESLLNEYTELQFILEALNK